MTAGATDRERWQRLNALFHQALERQGAERAAFVDKVLGSNPDLGHEIEQLLAAHDIAEEVLPENSALVVDPAAAEDEAVDEEELGAYRIVGVLGRGGMGVVYLAERADQQFERRVAIKRIKRGLDTEAVIERFRVERQILASLDHPNIARIIDAGTTANGLPYFVMDYIEGEPIDDYCAAHRLSVEARIALFQKVCAAVSYAHQRLVVHRDLKPSNILVTAEGDPKLLDFGIAKIMQPTAEDSRATELGRRAPLTPGYASPEQLKSQPSSTLSDVYSLGVVLYELLTGDRPAQPTGEPGEAVTLRPSDAVRRSQPSDDQEVPSNRMPTENLERLSRRLRGDLDTIVLTALRPEPERRYPSVERLSQDLHRHLTGLPVEARPDTALYRSVKFLRRHRTAVAVGVLLIASLLTGLLATAWQAQRATRAQARAERRFAEVRRLANTVLFDYHDAIKDLPGATPVRARLVKDALEYLDSLAEESGDDPSLQLELAAAYERVGDVQGGALMFANLGDTRGALASYQKALELSRRVAATDAQSTSGRESIASVDLKLGTLLGETGNLDEALEHCREAIALFEELLERSASPGREQLLHVATARDHVGLLLQEMGDPEGALKEFRAGLEALDSLSENDRSLERVRRHRSVLEEHIGSARLQAGEASAALEHNERAIDLRSVLARENPDNADHQRSLAISYYNQGLTLETLGRYSEALESYRRNIALIEPLLTADSQNVQYRADAAFAQLRIGEMLVRLNEPRAALEHYRQALDLRSGDIENDPESLLKRASLIEVEAQLTKALAEIGDIRASEQQGERTMTLLRETELEPNNAAMLAFFAVTYADLGEAQRTLADRVASSDTESRRHHRESCSLYRQSLGIWQDLDDRGLFGPSDEVWREPVVAALADC